MGGAVSSMMEWRNSSSMIDHPILTYFRSYGTEGEAVPGTEKEGCGPIYRFVNTGDEENARLTKEYYHGKNWVQMIQERALELGDRPALGYRTVERVENRVVKDAQGKEKTFQYYHCTPYKTISFKEMWHRIESFGRGLRDIGLNPHDMVTIYEETRWEWIVSVYGIWSQEMVTATVYANLGEDALFHALKETDSRGIVCNGKAVQELLGQLRKLDLHPIVIYLDELPTNVDTNEYTVIAWTEVVAKGEKRRDIPICIPTDNDIQALVMYTSGTTGNPKGVIHTHGSIASGIRALNHRLIDLYRPGDPEEIYCAYLPLAHILEFAIVNIFINRGTLVGFGSSRTLTDAYCLPHGDLREFKPKVIIAVPRIFDTIRKAVESKLPAPGTLKRKVFDKAFQSRRAALIKGKDTPYWNDKVFDMVRSMLGGNIYGMLSGGGPLSASTQEFINVMCGGPLIIQGWGLTETVCCGTTQRLGDLEPHCVGQLLKSAEIRLLDTEEFKHTDSPEPRGELLVRGPFLFKGYYKQPEMTKEVMDDEGWFHTGDVGAITKDGKVRLVGRVKALAKNALGEYLALETLEALYSQNDLCVTNGVCVLVHPDKNYIGAIALTDEGRAMAFAKAHHIAGTYPEILKGAAFLKAAAESLAQTARDAGRKSFECVRHVRVLNEEWTVESGLLTPTMKLRRNQVERHYQALIAEIFAE